MVFIQGEDKRDSGVYYGDYLCVTCELWLTLYGHSGKKQYHSILAMPLDHAVWHQLENWRFCNSLWLGYGQVVANVRKRLVDPVCILLINCEIIVNKLTISSQY